MSGMLRATERGFRCVDCGALLDEHEAIACERCDALELAQLRDLLLAEEREKDVAHDA